MLAHQDSLGELPSPVDRTSLASPPISAVANANALSLLTGFGDNKKQPVLRYGDRYLFADRKDGTFY